jgi:hypothetical protein
MLNIWLCLSQEFSKFTRDRTEAFSFSTPAREEQSTGNLPKLRSLRGVCRVPMHVYTQNILEIRHEILEFGKHRWHWFLMIMSSRSWRRRCPWTSLSLTLTETLRAKYTHCQNSSIVWGYFKKLEVKSWVKATSFRMGRGEWPVFLSCTPWKVRGLK